MKKMAVIVSLALFTASSAIVPFSATKVSAEASASVWLNQDAVNRGVISVAYPVRSNVQTKVQITKGSTSYTYNLPSRAEQAFPLQFGNGDYQVSVLEQVSGNKYRQIQKASVTVKLDNPNEVFLNSVQNVRWQADSQAAKLAAELTKSAKTDEEKAKAIYAYLVKNIKYDKKLAATGVKSDYLPEADRTLATKLGICYDYASLYAAMLRSQNIPTKMLMGTSDYVNVYHAWNEVYLNGKWVTVDTTVDAGKGVQDFSKDKSKYKASKVY
ncbi:transglutaminase-like domain-containing protein [Gorillibacterium sp. CAU 1737]|uniref:transglutaminase-like domain-containing protein n=1 Tax=Gorillibacterium sp. CAU 1737 TaxID=3140362 RepID=UPI003260E7C1